MMKTWSYSTQCDLLGSMQNFSISLKTCLLRSLGWIWPVWCLERTSCGYSLQPQHCQPLEINQYIRYLQFTISHRWWSNSVSHHFSPVIWGTVYALHVHLNRAWMLKYGSHQESSSVTRRCCRFGWPRTYISARGSLSRRMRGTHIYQDERRTEMRWTVILKEWRLFIILG